MVGGSKVTIASAVSLGGRAVIWARGWLLVEAELPLMFTSAQGTAARPTVLSEHDSIRITIVGYTDARERPARQDRLPVQRAAAARARLVVQGGRAERIAVVGRGARNPVDDNARRRGRSNNCRIEMVIWASKRPPIIPGGDPPSAPPAAP